MLEIFFHGLLLNVIPLLLHMHELFTRFIKFDYDNAFQYAVTVHIHSMLTHCYYYLVLVIEERLTTQHHKWGFQLYNSNQQVIKKKPTIKKQYATLTLSAEAML